MDFQAIHVPEYFAGGKRGNFPFYAILKQSLLFIHLITILEDHRQLGLLLRTIGVLRIVPAPGDKVCDYWILGEVSCDAEMSLLYLGLLF